MFKSRLSNVRTNAGATRPEINKLHDTMMRMMSNKLELLLRATAIYKIYLGRDTFAVRYPHNLRGGIRMIECALSTEFRRLLVQGNNLHFVVVFLHKASQS